MSKEKSYTQVAKVVNCSIPEPVALSVLNVLKNVHEHILREFNEASTRMSEDAVDRINNIIDDVEMNHNVLECALFYNRFKHPEKEYEPTTYRYPDRSDGIFDESGYKRMVFDNIKKAVRGDEGNQALTNVTA